MASLSQDLWRPSARRGADHPEAGQALPGVPWTALLSAPERRTAPAAEAMRRWVAEAFGAPKEHVEAVRLISDLASVEVTWKSWVEGNSFEAEQGWSGCCVRKR